MEELGFNTKVVNWIRTCSEYKMYVEEEMSIPFILTSEYGQGLKNIFRIIRFQKHILKSLRIENPEVIVACDLDTLLAAMLWSFFGDTKIIYDQFDPIASRLKGTKITNVLRIIESLVSKRANFAITANINRVGKNDIFWFEFPNLNMAFNETVQKSIKSERTESEYRLYYAGIFQSDRGLMAAANAISQQHGWVFELNGFGKHDLKSSIVNVDSSKIFESGYVPSNEIRSKLRKADLYLATYDPKYSHNLHTASNKFYEGIQCKTPILATKDTDLGRLVEKYGVGFVVDYENVGELRFVFETMRKWSNQDYEVFYDNCNKASADFSALEFENRLRKKIIWIMKESWRL